MESECSGCIFSIIRGRGTALRLPSGATARVRPYKLRRYSGCIKIGLMISSKASAGRVGSGGAVPKCSVSTEVSHQPRLAARTVSRPSGLCTHDPLGLDTDLAANLSDLESRLPTLISIYAPPDPTRPALASKHANQPILDAPKCFCACSPRISLWNELRTRIDSFCR